MNIIRIARSAVAFAALTGLALAAASAADNAVTVDMKAQNGSGESGTATLTQTDAGVKVDIDIKNGTDAAQPAHIHQGTCPKINPAPQYPLTNVTDGKSTTVVKGVKLADLLKGPYAINVHKSTSDLATYVSCGDIKASM